MAIAMRCPFVDSRNDRLNDSQSKDFLKFWRNLLSHERPHLAIWVKLSRPVCVRISSMVSMKKDWKDLLKFVWPERAFEIISLSWIRGLIFMSCNLKCGNSKLLKIKHLSKFFKRYFHLLKHFFRLCSMPSARCCKATRKRAIVYVSNWKLYNC